MEFHSDRVLRASNATLDRATRQEESYAQAMVLAEGAPPLDPLDLWGFTRLDRAILALARRNVGDTNDFGAAVRALGEATERLIPAGRVYVLGAYGGVPIVGSVVSGVGIVCDARRIRLVRVERGSPLVLGAWSP